MRLPKPRWSTNTNYAMGSNRVGSIYQNLRGKRGWIAVCTLPGAAIPVIYREHANPEDARKVVETAVAKWLEGCGAK